MARTVGGRCREGDLMYGVWICEELDLTNRVNTLQAGMIFKHRLYALNLLVSCG